MTTAELQSAFSAMAEGRQIALITDAGDMEHVRKNAIRECVVWLVQNNANYKPEALAEMMASDMLSEAEK